MAGKPVFFAYWLPVGLLALAAPATVQAHGAALQHRLLTGVAITAEYDSGQPMAGARITVYAPHDPATPWLTGQADERGRFSFVPDPELPGTWSVQARQTGHGAMIHIPLSAAAAPGSEAVSPPPADSAATPAQRWLMALAVVWGLVGTALFFLSRRRR